MSQRPGLAALGLLALAAGCGGTPLPAAANLLPGDDPRAPGQKLFFLETWGTEALGQWPTADFLVELQTKEPEVFGDQFRAFGFLKDEHDDLPIGLKRGEADPTNVHETCAMCHVGKLPDGSMQIGMPNRELDIGRFRAEVNARWMAAGHAPIMSALEAEKSRKLGPGRFDAESGDYPTAVPADFPPYFTLARRNYLNYLGTGGDVRTEASFAIYSFGAVSPNAETAKVPFPTDKKLADFVAFFGTIDPPAAPAGDAALIARGAQVFTSARCDSCHHVGSVEDDAIVPYSKDGIERMPGDDPSFPLGTIATDIAHRALVDDTLQMGMGTGTSSDGVDQGYLDLIAFIGAHGLSIHLSDGYRVNDLRGLWATAPYLHNGSVPTLEDLLSPPAQRPASFMRGDFLVDSTAPGGGNGGHAFGTELSAEDKTALVAYLKSL